MKTWICKVCGYSHFGGEAPQNCPKCGAPKYQFYRERKISFSFFGIILLLLIATIIAYFLYSCHSPIMADNTPINNLDISRYQGRWYEIARFDHGFERGMEQCTAFYTLQKDGTIKVINKGIKNGKPSTNEGKAITTRVPGILRVSFFGPFYSDYRILMLAPNYSYALVGGSSDDYLWMLSRTPQIDNDTRSLLVQEAQRRGYDTSNLIWVKHNTKNT